MHFSDFAVNSPALVPSDEAAERAAGAVISPILQLNNFSFGWCLHEFFIGRLRFCVIK